MSTLLFPGLGGSGEGHWQRHWLDALPLAKLVEQSDWDQPDLGRWVANAIDAILASPNSVLVGHSLGAVLIAHLAATRPDLPIKGALLVAPADVDEAPLPPNSVSGFGPMPTSPFPFRAMVVASRNDPFMRYDRARVLSSMWEAQLVDLGNAGHINVASGHGPWPEGRLLVDRVADRVTRPFLISSRPDNGLPKRRVSADGTIGSRASASD
jgi:predicted alpha/beta hydrolase family esterase